MKTDLRVKKTKKAIYEAFITLMDTKGFTTMTVQDILDEALINRKTFYTYYHDKYDLAEQIAQNFLDKLDTLLQHRFSSETNQFSIDSFYKELYKNKKELLAIWNIRTDHINVFNELSMRLQSIYTTLATNYNIPGNQTLQAHMFSTFVLSSYEYIMHADQTYQTHQLLEEYQHIYEVIEKTSHK